MESMLKVRTAGHTGRWCLGVTTCLSPDRDRCRTAMGQPRPNHPVDPSGQDTTSRTMDPAVTTLPQPRLGSSSQRSHATRAGVDSDTICMRFLMRQMSASWPLQPPIRMGKEG